MDPGRPNRARRPSWLPPIATAGNGKSATPIATLGFGNAPSSLARCLPAGHPDKDDADERHKWRCDRILAASETIGVG